MRRSDDEGPSPPFSLHSSTSREYEWPLLSSLPSFQVHMSPEAHQQCWRTTMVSFTDLEQRQIELYLLVTEIKYRSPCDAHSVILRGGGGLKGWHNPSALQSPSLQIPICPAVPSVILQRIIDALYRPGATPNMAFNPLLVGLRLD